MTGNFIKQLKGVFFLVRNDREASAQLRVLIMGLATCLAVYYASQALIIAPNQKKLAQRRAEKAESQAMSTLPSPVGETDLIEQLRQKKALLQEEIAVLNLRKKFQVEQWQAMGDPERFHRIIFSMNPSAPVNMEKVLSQMVSQEKQTREFFSEYPVHLEGTGDFRDFITYLEYIERSPEINRIDNLNLSRSSRSRPTGSDPVDFSLMVSRIILENKP